MTLTLAAAILGGGGAVSAKESAPNVILTPDTAPGNIFRGTQPVFRLQIDNPSNAPCDVSMDYKITDASGVVAEHGSDTFVLPAGSRNSKVCRASMDGRYGSFTFSVTLHGGGFEGIERSCEFMTAAAAPALSDFMGMVPHFGAQIQSSPEYPEASVSSDMVTDGGFGWVRDELRWIKVETERHDPAVYSPGNYIMPDKLDEYINIIHKSGQKLLLVLGYTNPNYDDGGLPTSPEGIQAFINYCRFVIETHIDKIDAVEIWNEPISPNMTGGIESTPEQYAALLKAVYPAIQQVYSSAGRDPVPILAGSTFPLGNTKGYGGMITGNIGAGCDWLKPFLSVPNIKNYMDALSLHPYSSRNGYYPDENRDSRATEMWYSDLADQIDYWARTYLRDYAGAEDMPIWITEYGISSSDGGTDKNGTYQPYTEEQQAVGLVRAAAIAEYCNVEHMFLYNFKEKGTETTGADGYEDNFGIVGYNYEGKPAYAALSWYNSLLANADITAGPADFGLKTDKNSRKLAAYEFTQKNGERVFMLWTNRTKTTDAENTANLTLSTDGALSGAELKGVDSGSDLSYTIVGEQGAGFRCYDMYGNETDPPQTVDQHPIYVVYIPAVKPLELDLSESDGAVSISGGSAVPTSYVTMTARLQNAVGAPVRFMDQTTADAGGNYGFKFAVRGGDFYEVRVRGGGEYASKFAGNEDYEIKMTYYADGQPLNGSEELRPGMTISARAEVTRRNAEIGQPSLLLYGVVSSGRLMTKLDIADLTWDGDTATAEAEVVLEDETDVKALQFLLWNENMQPLMNADR